MIWVYATMAAILALAAAAVAGYAWRFRRSARLVSPTAVARHPAGRRLPRPSQPAPGFRRGQAPRLDYVPGQTRGQTR
ncbi:hypothetical protein [Streptomyces sp. NPDC002692]